MAKEEKKTIKDLPGVGPTTMEKLEAAGYTDLMSIATATIKKLAEAVGMGDAAARKAIQFAKEYADVGFSDGFKVDKKQSLQKKITTGVKEFDALLDGGFHTGCIMECYGKWGSAKTQIAHQLAVNVQLPEEKGGLNGKAVFIDTENTFKASRIKQMAAGVEIDVDKALKNIIVGRAFNSDHQMLLIEKVEEMLKAGEKIKIIVIDSLMAHFRSEFIGRATLADRQQKISKHMSELLRISDVYDLCIYVTNQAVDDPSVMFGDPTRAIGGNIVGHTSAFRIYLRKSKKNSRVAKLVDSPHLPDGECIFLVTEAGLTEA